jgi:hypothetical protein
LFILLSGDLARIEDLKLFFPLPPFVSDECSDLTLTTAEERDTGKNWTLQQTDTTMASMIPDHPSGHGSASAGSSTSSSHNRSTSPISVRAKSLLRRRLNRTFSRTCSPSRSPSPSRNKEAKPIAAAAAAAGQMAAAPPQYTISEETVAHAAKSPEISSSEEAAQPAVEEHESNNSDWPTVSLEETPVLLMRFTDKATPKLITWVEKRLQNCGLLVLHKIQTPQDNPNHDNSFVYLYLSAAQEALEAFAEQIRWMKRTNDTHVVEYFTVNHRRQFIHTKKKNRDKKFDSSMMGGNDLFTSNEWCHLTFRLLDSVEVCFDGESSSELNLMLLLQAENAVIPTISSSTGKRSSRLRLVLQANHYVDVVTPLHWGPARDAIVQATWKPFPLMPPVHEIRNYYGEDVAFYFAWMGLLSQWLVVLGAMGVLVSGFRFYRNDTIDEDEYTPFYGLFAFLWAILFLRFWERHEHRLAHAWGTYSLSVYERAKFTVTRPEFKGTLRKSPVTGDYETYYPPSKRRAKYVVSALVTGVMLAVAFSLMILSLNMQGYIHPERNPDRWNEHNPHPFHYPSLAVLSYPNHIFDSKHTWKCFIPTVVHVAMIFALNNLYRIIATMLTDWENHETEASHRNSLILKRFLFEAFDCYVALFYLAFYERDVERLRLELVAVFNVDTFRRMSLECILPMLVQKVSKKLQHHQQHQHHPNNANNNNRTKNSPGRNKHCLKADANNGINEAPDHLSSAFERGSRNSIMTKTATSATDTNTSLDISSAGRIRGLASAFARRFKKNRSPTLAELAEEADKDEYVSANSRTCAFSIQICRGQDRRISLSLLSSRSEVILGPRRVFPSVSSLSNVFMFHHTLLSLFTHTQEAFDDYMEIVIQFGYVTLFASAYPLASLVALMANWVEIRSDCIKLAKVCRRPRSFRADGIGMWNSLLSSVVWMSALTNCLIVGFTSDQMKEIFPNFYMVDAHGDTHLVHDKGWIAVFVIFGLERVLLLLGLFIYAIVPAVPEDVHDEVEKLHHVRAQEHEEVVRQVMLKRSSKKKI